MIRLLYAKRKELSDAANKLKNGLSKIDETREKVQTMSGELEEARANVAVFQKQCEEFLVIIVQQKRDADEQQKVWYTQHCVILFLSSRSINRLAKASKTALSLFS